MMETDDDNNYKAEFHFAVFTAVSQLSPPFIQDVKNKTETLLERREVVSIRDIKEVLASSDKDLIKALCGVGYKPYQPVDCVSDTCYDVKEGSVQEELDCPLEEESEKMEDVTVEDAHDAIVDVKDGDVVVDNSIAAGDAVEVRQDVDEEVFEHCGDDDHVVPQEPSMPVPHDEAVTDSLIDPNQENEQSPSSVESIPSPVVNELEKEHCIQEKEEEKEESAAEDEENACQPGEEVIEVEDKEEQIIAEQEHPSEEETSLPEEISVAAEIQPAALENSPASVDPEPVIDHWEQPSPVCQPPDEPLPVAPAPVKPSPTPKEDAAPPTNMVQPIPRSLFPAQPLCNSVTRTSFVGAGSSTARVTNGISQPVPEVRHFNFARIGDVPAAWDPALAAANSHTVIIGQATDPTNFYVARHYEEGRNDVAAMMSAWWKNERSNPEIALKPAAIVAGLPVAVVTSPSIIERGVVVSVDPARNSAVVRFIDKGSMDNVNFSRLCHITKHQMSDQFPKQAVHCTVDLHAHKFEDGRDTWPPQVMNSMRKAVETKAQYTAVFAGERDSKTIVNLYIPRYGYEEKKSFLAHVCKYLAICKRRKHSPTESHVTMFGETSSEMSQSDLNTTLETDFEDEGDESEDTLLDVDIDLDNEIETPDSIK